jgi:hypothetical protein
VLENSNFYGGEKGAYWIHKKGGMTHRDILKADVEEALKYSKDAYDFESRLKALGYQLNHTEDKYRHLTVKAKNWKRPIRLDSIGYTREAINARFDEHYENIYFFRIQKEHPQYRPKGYPLLDFERELDYESDDNRTTAEIGESVNESYKTIQRYIRLTDLIPQILQKVDEGRISFTPAVQLSYLAEQEQYDLLETIESEDCTPSLSQAQRIKKLSQEGHLNMDVIFAILTEEKANQKEKLKIPMERVRYFFPKDYTAAQMEETIVKMCEERYRKKMRDRDAR